MKTRRIAAAVLVAFLSSTATFPALAQEDAVTNQARARFKEGVDFYDKGQFENARLAFLQAYALKKHPAVLLNLAQSSAKAGHPLEASKYFQQYLRESPSATAEQRQAAESGLADVRQKVGRVEIVAPAGTEITLDDKDRLGTAPFTEPVEMELGPHTLKSSSETVKVIAIAGQKVQAKFAGGGSAAAAPPPVAPPPVEPKPEPKNETPPSNASDNAGTTTVGADTGKKGPGLLSPPESMTPVYVGLVGAGVGLIGAIMFASFKANAQSSADLVANDIRTAAGNRDPQGNTLPPGTPAAVARLPASGVCNSTTPKVQQDFGTACQTLKDDNSKVDTDATVANISLVVMGVGLVTAAGWYLFAPKRTSDSAKAPIVVTPYAGWGNGGVTVGGAF